MRFAEVKRKSFSEKQQNASANFGPPGCFCTLNVNTSSIHIVLVWIHTRHGAAPRTVDGQFRKVPLPREEVIMIRAA